MSGAFLTSRDIFSNPIWTNIVEFRLFFLIYGNAVFSEEGYRVGDIDLKRGQWLRSIRNICKDLEYIENRSVKTYSTSVVKRAVDSLVAQGRISVEQTELGTLFTVVNYEVYQGFSTYTKSNSEQRENTEVKPQEKKKPSEKGKYDEDSTEMKTAMYFVSKIREWKPDLKQPDLQKWADTFRLIYERDKRTKREIVEVIDWVTDDSFWKANILSPDKLRKQWDKLTARMTVDKQKTQQPKQMGYQSNVYVPPSDIIRAPKGEEVIIR